MSRARRYGIVVLGAVFALAALGYSFFQSFIPNAVFGAVPEQATFAFKADSLEELLASPVCEQLDKALAPGRSLEALLGSNPWTKLAAPSEIVVADLPLRRPGQNRCRVAVSWVGWRSPWLRWKLERTRAVGFSFIGKHSVWPVWKYENPGIAQDGVLTFALTDNLFIACLSKDSADILQLLDTYDHRIPAFGREK